MFKKSLSIILALLMTLSCMTALALPAVAADTPTGTPIDSLDDIEDYAGDYYLTTHIGSEDVPNETTVTTEFTGTLDGNGCTIYTSVPLFETIGAGTTIKNLTVAGNLSFDNTTANSGYGVFAKQATGAFTMTDCTNYADVSYSTTAHFYIGGFVGKATHNGGINMENCVNRGDIIMPNNGTSGQVRVGGLIGGTVAASGTTTLSTYTACKNYGTIDDKSASTFGGGLIGLYQSTDNIKFDSCENHGTVKGTPVNGVQSFLGGILAHGDKNTEHTFLNCRSGATAVVKGAQGAVGGLVGVDKGNTLFQNCTVEGEVGYYGEVLTTTRNEGVGGILGQAGSATTITFIGCTNKATITAINNMGGIVGYTAANLNMFDCTNEGEVSTVQETTMRVRAGGLVGVQVWSQSITLYFENCANKANISITSTSSDRAVGGIIGSAETKSSRTFINCTNSGNITSSGGTDTTTAIGVGGIAGNIGNNQETAGSSYIGCVNRGAISVDGHKGANGYAGGIVGYAKGNSDKFISCVNNGNVSFSDTCTTTNAIAAGLCASAKGTVAAYSCVNDGAISNAINNDNAKAVQLYDGGTLKYCESEGTTTVAVEFEGIQRSIPVDGEETFSLRFITGLTNIDDYSMTGILIYVATSESASVDFKDVDTDTVYTQISGSADGVNVVYPETPVDGKYFTALTVTDISVEKTYSFIVVPYTVAIDGQTTVYGDAYTTVVTKGEITECYMLSEQAN